MLTKNEIQRLVAAIATSALAVYFWNGFTVIALILAAISIGITAYDAFKTKF